MSITRINQFQAADDKAQELWELLQEIVPYIQSSQGCLSCQLLKKQDKTGEFVVLEQWQSIEAHQQSIALFPKEKMQAAMPLLQVPPSGDYYHE